MLQRRHRESPREGIFVCDDGTDDNNDVNSTTPPTENTIPNNTVKGDDEKELIGQIGENNGSTLEQDSLRDNVMEPEIFAETEDPFPFTMASTDDNNHTICTSSSTYPDENLRSEMKILLPRLPPYVSQRENAPTYVK